MRGQHTRRSGRHGLQFLNLEALVILSLIYSLWIGGCTLSKPITSSLPTLDSQVNHPGNPTTPQPGITQPAFSSLLDTTDFYYEAGDFELVVFIYSEMLLYPLNTNQTRQVFSLRADAYGQMGNFDQAIEDYRSAVKLGENRPVILNSLCWDLGITGKPEAALSYCEQAARDKLIPEYRDSRGLVYAMLGKRVAAIADFKAVIQNQSTDSPEYQKKVNKRKEWITLLESGINPVTSHVLEELRRETAASMALPTSTPGLVSEITGAEIERSALKLGFGPFSAVDNSDPPEVSAQLTDGECQATIRMREAGMKLSRAQLSLIDCKESDEIRYIGWWMELFLPGKADHARSIVWLAVDIKPLIQDKPNHTLTRQIGAYTFSVESRPKAASSLSVWVEMNE
ncbi:MAG: tetratricopeptide repeat protein [Omnitrophica WOR_2 bacterium]